jgi:hypothetical protein
MPRKFLLNTIKADISDDGRIETGPLQINDDWPGVFIRGDNAMFYGMALRQLLAMLKDESDIHRMLAISPLYGLAELLASCNVRNLTEEGND